MAYKLFLTYYERQAIDWVGNRYSNGHQLRFLLWGESTATPNDIDWDSPGDITFDIPESVAWQIAENSANEDGFWPCFDAHLANKLQDFVNAIV